MIRKIRTKAELISSESSTLPLILQFTQQTLNSDNPISNADIGTIGNGNFAFAVELNTKDINSDKDFYEFQYVLSESNKASSISKKYLFDHYKVYQLETNYSQNTLSLAQYEFDVDVFYKYDHDNKVLESKLMPKYYAILRSYYDKKIYILINKNYDFGNFLDIILTPKIYMPHSIMPDTFKDKWELNKITQTDSLVQNIEANNQFQCYINSYNLLENININDFSLYLNNYKLNKNTYDLKFYYKIKENENGINKEFYIDSEKLDEYISPQSSKDKDYYKILMQERYRSFLKTGLDSSNLIKIRVIATLYNSSASKSSKIIMIKNENQLITHNPMDNKNYQKQHLNNLVDYYYPVANGDSGYALQKYISIADILSDNENVNDDKKSNILYRTNDIDLPIYSIFLPKISNNLVVSFTKILKSGKMFDYLEQMNDSNIEIWVSEKDKKKNGGYLLLDNNSEYYTIDYTNNEIRFKKVEDIPELQNKYINIVFYPEGVIGNESNNASDSIESLNIEDYESGFDLMNKWSNFNDFSNISYKTESNEEYYNGAAQKYFYLIDKNDVPKDNLGKVDGFLYQNELYYDSNDQIVNNRDHIKVANSPNINWYSNDKKLNGTIINIKTIMKNFADQYVKNITPYEIAFRDDRTEYKKYFNSYKNSKDEYLKYIFISNTSKDTFERKDAVFDAIIFKFNSDTVFDIEFQDINGKTIRKEVQCKTGISYDDRNSIEYYYYIDYFINNTNGKHEESKMKLSVAPDAYSYFYRKK